MEKIRKIMSGITPMMAALLSVVTLGIFGVAYALLDEEKESKTAGSEHRLDR